MKIKSEILLEYFDELYPNAKCELNYHNVFELLIAVMLSAQTTDKSVNNVTPLLFKTYPTIEGLSNAKISDVENIIHSIGLYHNKAKNIVECAKVVHNEFNDIVPNTLEVLTSLPGVGRKTASVVLIEGYKIPAFPVDTHVERVAKRLGIAKKDDTVYQVEMKICKMIAKEKWEKAHHQFIFFGRYFCKAIKPNCQDCKLKEYCHLK